MVERITASLDLRLAAEWAHFSLNLPRKSQGRLSLASMGSRVHLWASRGGWGTESLSWPCMSLLQPYGFLHTWARGNVRLFQLKCQILRGNGHFRGSFPQPALCGVANMHYRFEWPKESSFKRSVNFFPQIFFCWFLWITCENLNCVLLLCCDSPG